MSFLNVDDIRAFISDFAQNNHLLDGEEFTDSEIVLAMDVAVDLFNVLPPLFRHSRDTFPSKAVLMYGTLGCMFDGKAALLARNHLEYSDGGLTVPVEERYQLYRSLADGYKTQYQEMAAAYKIAVNMESGWGEVRSDYAGMPAW